MTSDLARDIIAQGIVTGVLSTVPLLVVLIVFKLIKLIK